MMKSILMLLPELGLIAFISALFMRTLFEKRFHHKITSHMAIIFSLAVVVASILAFNLSGSVFMKSYEINHASQLFKLLLSVLLFVVILLSGKAQAIPRGQKTEYLIFLACATLGMMILVSANEFLLFYIALELVAYSTYVMIPFRKDPRAAEASIKYIILGATTSAILIYGISLVAGIARSTYFADILLVAPSLFPNPLFMIGCLFILCGIFFKLSLFPFHFWAPDVYEVAPTSVVTFLATSSKATAAFMLIKVLATLGSPAILTPILITLAVLSMTLGNATAILQKDLKRLFAYSSIAQSGYIMVAALVMNQEANQSVIFYVICYAIMNLAAFLVIILIGRSMATNNPQASDLNGLSKRSPLLAFLLLVSVLSLAGIPPLAGFAGKWFLFASAVQAGYSWLVLFAVINSVISLYYYLILVKHAYVDKATLEAPIDLDYRYKAVVVCILGLLLSIGVYPTLLMDLATIAANSI
ncbi:MAG: proton-translocating NADH-quinone oxidoreductase chain N [Candidatus Omnitrophota bacterium]|jgi:proton-translocating NADH-quinone oxidoreductase chain N